MATSDWSEEIEMKEKPKVTRTDGLEIGNPKLSEQQFPSWDSLTPEQKLLWSSTPDLPTNS